MSTNNMFPVTLLITAAVLCIGVAHADDHADATASLKKEIAAFRTKTATIRKNIEHEKKKAAADSLSYAACLREQADRSDRLKAERDSLQKFSLLLQHRRDSLTETGAATALQKQSLARRGAHLLAALQANCRQLIDSKNCLHAFSSGNLFLIWSMSLISPPFLRRYYQTCLSDTDRLKPFFRL